MTLSDFDRPAETPQQVAMRQAGLEIANQYAVLFVHNQIGAGLLKRWTEGYANKRTPVNAPITEYAANEAVRAFIQGIHDQIKLAQDPAMR